MSITTHPTTQCGTEDKAEELLNLDESMEDVELRFAQILEKRGNEEASEGKDKDVKKLTAFKTPVKANTLSQQDALDFSNLTSGYLSRNLSFDQNTILGLKKGLDTAALSDIVNILVQNSMELPQFLIDFTNTADTLSTVVQHKISDMKGLVTMLNNVKQEIGYLSASKPAEMPGSVWEAIKWLSELITVCSSKISQLETQGVTRDKDSQTLTKDLKSVLSSFQTRLVKLTDKVKALESTTSLVPQAQGSGLGNLQLASSPTNVSHQVKGINATNLSGFNKTLDGINDRIDTLEEHNCLRDEQGLLESVRFLGHTFVDQNDMELWLSQNGLPQDIIPPFGLFVDPILLYYWVYTRMVGGGTLQSDLAT